jgi:hypothetical protein
MAEILRRHRDGLALLAGLLAPLGVAGLLTAFRTSFANSAAAVILVGVVVAVAAIGSRVAGFVAACSAALWFDFFLTRPYERLSIAGRSDIETAVCLLLVGIAVTELAARRRHHFAVATEESGYVSDLYEISELAAGSTPSAELVDRACERLSSLLFLRSCRFERGTSEGPLRRIESDGSVRLGSVGWGAQTMGLPGKELELPVRSRGRSVGRFILEPTPGLPVSLERRVVAVAIADQVGAALSLERGTA